MKAGWFVALLLMFSACDLYEARGFVTSYETADERFEQSMEYNRQQGITELSTPIDFYQLFVMGDSHLGSSQNLSVFFADAIREKSLAVVLAGDLTTGQKSGFDELAATLPSTDSLNYFGLAGNHDIYFDGWQHYRALFGSSTYFFVVTTPAARDLFICLDTSGGTLGELQLEWFTTLLAEQRDAYRHCIVVTHNNLLRLRPTLSTNPHVDEI